MSRPHRPAARPWRTGGLAQRALPAILAAALAGCAAWAPRPAATLGLLEGRLSLQVEGQPDRSFSAGFSLSGDAQRGEMLLSGPLGTAAARARWSPGQARLLSAGRETEHPSLDALAAAALGEALPMAALFDWLQGRPWPGAPSVQRGDGAAGFDQLGWQVDLQAWPDGLLQARRPAPPVVTVRVRLERPG